MTTWLAFVIALLNRGACWDASQNLTAHTNRCTLN